MAKLVQLATIKTIKSIVQPLLDDPKFLQSFSDHTDFGINETPLRTITMKFVVAEEADNQRCTTKFTVYEYTGDQCASVVKRPCTAIELHRDSARA